MFPIGNGFFVRFRLVRVFVGLLLIGQGFVVLLLIGQCFVVLLLIGQDVCWFL